MTELRSRLIHNLLLARSRQSCTRYYTNTVASLCDLYRTQIPDLAELASGAGKIFHY